MTGAPIPRFCAFAAVTMFAAIGACNSGQQSPERPRHLVLVSIDTLSALHVGAYGYSRPTTPTLDALAAEGTLFEHAYTPQAWTLTAHASLLTGLYPAAHGADEHLPLRMGAVTLAEQLTRFGFHTFGLVSTIWLVPSFGMARGFSLYGSSQTRPGQKSQVVKDFLEQQAAVSASDSENRFFLFLHYYEPHSDAGTDVPYWAPPPFGFEFLGGSLDWERRGDTGLLFELQELGAPLRDLEVIGALYDGGVLYTDRDRLRPVIGWLREFGLLADTLVVVTADHGEELYEHGQCVHQQPYEETARVPLVLHGPGVPAGRRVPDLVELVDVMPTVLSLLGVPAPDNVQGRSLVPLLRGERVAPRMAFVDGILGTTPPYFSVHQSGAVAMLDGRRWSLVTQISPNEEVAGSGSRNFRVGDARELYLLDDDPGQTHDIAADHPEIADRLERALVEWYAENEAMRVRLGAPAERLDRLSKTQRDELRALGYVGDERGQQRR